MTFTLKNCLNFFFKLTVPTEDNITAESKGKFSPVNSDCVRVCGQLYKERTMP